ncbi:NAD-dependent succinate-semialdehyde dehydrogenase [Lacticaseibacillus thailandensis]|uniref:Succinate-semialdehyde dehydrogenase (NADP+) n=1 Tax=Lacticaseibacillus thailandensis DSM 22698 = JCM 13996 TaxID=1423810 RepID=A0A0R2CF81_9LACO|nr:NAD-dependent succinate-semialdehyde dehydrogenase [Lacticaseibacillus thailandensis]KRM86828.1 succinate-semialdehyde dehydrogenase (NADP+) [Lacticaseibacillus thailandensis DSM 22698 = JCM 13996]
MAYQTINPYTNKLVRTYPNASDADLEAALTAGYARYQQFRNEAPATRSAALHQVATLMRQEKHELAKVLTIDMGKLIGEAEAEVALCADIADYFADHGADMLADTPLTTNAGAAYYAKQAVGVLVMVEPWNFPYYQLMRVFAPNFMVGNTMILKHSSITPGSAEAFVDVLKRAGVPDGSFTNLFINYDQVGKAIADPRVAGVALTGSERGGASVAQEAGAHLKKSTLELGGNDAFIILPDADWDVVKQAAPQARLMNAGQICTASKRFIVVGDRYDDFVDFMTQAFAKVQPGDPLDPATTLAPLSSAKAKAKLQEQVDSAVAGGAHVAYGNTPIDSEGAFFQPTVLTDIDHDNPTFNQELFGPVASIYHVDTEEEAIALANDSSYGLGSSVFSQDAERADRVARQLEAGMTFINRAWLSLPELPFGGVKNSGYGRELYQLGLNAFVNEHLVLAQQ